MKIHKGNLEIEEGDTRDFSQLNKVTGYLYLSSNRELKALKSVGGYLYLSSNTELKAPKLESVGGHLYLNSNAELKALKSVGGYLSLSSNTELKALKSVGGYLSLYPNAELKAPKLESVGGYLSLSSNTELKAPKLESVGGYLYLNSNISHDLEKRLWAKNSTKKTKWRITNLASDWLIEKVATKENSEFRINNVTFGFEWFEKIRKDQLTAEEVFAIDNVEHRRVAYEMMDKAKMKDLKDFKILDEGVDKKGNAVKLISFNVQNMENDLVFYNCFCPSTMREYYLQMDKQTSWKQAKDAMFGLEDVDWVDEW